MSDAAIKAALEAGERAMREWTQGSALPGMWNKEASAAAIAAFLRALPHSTTEEHVRLWSQMPPSHEPRLWLAAAIERAAGGGA